MKITLNSLKSFWLCLLIAGSVCFFSGCSNMPFHDDDAAVDKSITERTENGDERSAKEAMDEPQEGFYQQPDSN